MFLQYGYDTHPMKITLVPRFVGHYFPKYGHKNIYYDDFQYKVEHHDSIVIINTIYRKLVEFVCLTGILNII